MFDDDDAFSLERFFAVEIPQLSLQEAEKTSRSGEAKRQSLYHIMLDTMYIDKAVRVSQGPRDIERKR